MDNKLTKEIDDTALALLKAVFGNIETMPLPIDLNRIVTYCGLVIKQGTFTTDLTTEGALDRKSKTIFLQEDDTQERKSFTAAHEIGHFKLHDNVKTDVFRMHDLDDLLTREGGDVQEDEADLFAASLLMPKKLVETFWNITKDASILAKIFGVPTVAVEFRLKKLKLI